MRTARVDEFGAAHIAQTEGFTTGIGNLVQAGFLLVQGTTGFDGVGHILRDTDEAALRFAIHEGRIFDAEVAFDTVARAGGRTTRTKRHPFAGHRPLRGGQYAFGKLRCQHFLQVATRKPGFRLAIPSGELTIDVGEARLHVKGRDQRRNRVDDRPQFLLSLTPRMLGFARVGDVLQQRDEAACVAGDGVRHQTHTQHALGIGERFVAPYVVEVETLAREGALHQGAGQGIGSADQVLNFIAHEGMRRQLIPG